MVTNFDTSSRERGILIYGDYVYIPLKNIWLEKEKYLEKLKKPVSVLR